ncbi:MAG: ABC transporter substrate-binding protein [Chloroflexi bacterium]|nr:ABC transporter substrate-binding protein [Chloroflexota bacterium]MCC6895289.1 ABC transporter substrate-binding protein [Anaerolineae bacterium]
MKSRLTLLTLALLTTVGAVLPAAAQSPSANLTDECVSTFDANTDYFPEKVTVDTASGFDVEYHNNYKIVTVNTPWQGAEEPLTYVLVQCGTPAPEGIEATATIEVPVNSVVSMSTSFLPHLTSQDLLDKVVAVDSALYTSNEAIVAGVADGTIAEIGGGGGGTEADIEKLIDLEPELVLSQRFSADDTVYPAMQQAGLPVVIDADFLDATPLGVAEWGKFISVFFNTESIAQEAFTGVNTRYEEVATLAKNAETQPTVFANTPFSGTWYMPGGASYLATLVRDAGGEYLWADDETTGSIMLSLEEVLDAAADADYWVNIFQNTAADVLALDERLNEFAAFQNGQMYTNNARLNANYGSDFYENGYANPDVLLADLVKIFHPDLLPEHELYYYAQLAQ